MGPVGTCVGPVGTCDRLEVVQGVQLGHRATWFGGGRARPAPAPAPLPPPRTSGWRPGGKAVRLFSPWPQMQIHAPAARVTRLPTPSKISSGHVLENSAHVASFSHSFLGESLGKGSELHFHCGILVRGIYIANRCPESPWSRVSPAASPENGVANGSRLRELPA
jgi:hypothetical protein